MYLQAAHIQVIYDRLQYKASQKIFQLGLTST